MFISLTSMAGGVLNAYGKFAIPAITPVILNICMIISAFIGGGTVQVLAYAVFVGGLLQLAFQLPSLVRLRLLPTPRWAWGDGRVRQIVRLMGPVMIGSSVAQISLLLNSNLSTHIGDGSVSWLYYANRLMEFPLGIFSIAVGTAILPTLAAQHAKKTAEQFSNTIDWGLRTILLIGTPATLGLILLAGPLVATVYGYHRFTAHDVMMTTYALWAYGLGFMGFSLVKVLAPGFYARQDTRVPVRYAILSLCIGMALSLSLFAWSRVHPFAAAHVVLAVSTSLTACINGGLLLMRLRRDSVYRPAPGWSGFSLRLLLANVAMAVVILLLAGDLGRWIAAGWQWKAAHMGLIVVTSMLVYFAVLGVCGLRPRHFRPAVR
jgi:putative peptidoglycan lipid II flippase